MRNATLILEDGHEFHGKSFGSDRNTSGEVVFCSAMTGYPESLTDASYAGQILTFTYPLVGNYGVPPFTEGENGLMDFFDGKRIMPSAIIVTDYSDTYSHWNASDNLANWLKCENVPAITGVDTRELTKVIRENGVMKGRIVIEGENEAPATCDYETKNFAEELSCREIIRYGEGNGKKVVVLDCGVKDGTIRSLLAQGVEVIRVPWNYDFNDLEFDGLYLAEGPGNPAVLKESIANVKKFIEASHAKPCLGVGLGLQLLALASGATIEKLKSGHRSANQPVREVGTPNCFITNQNHGYVVVSETLPADWKPLFVNLNDGTIEGIRHAANPWFASQFNPERCCMPLKMVSIYEQFICAL